MMQRQFTIPMAVLLATLGSACAAPAPAVFTALRHDGSGTHAVGTVSLDASSRLTVRSATADSDWLRGLVARTNANDLEHLDAPPPPGAPRGASVSIPVNRSDPRFAAAMRQDLMTYYGLELQPAP